MSEERGKVALIAVRVPHDVDPEELGEVEEAAQEYIDANFDWGP
jgi:hypothetical protein